MTPRVLVVEDEMLIAMMLEDMLVELGYQVVGPVARLERALDAVRREHLDAALLDVSLDGEAVYPVAVELAARGVPFVFATGYSGLVIQEPWRDRPLLRKPFESEVLRRAFAQLLSAPGPGLRLPPASTRPAPGFPA
jgi:CheY-like chemotaxis protein